MLRLLLAGVLAPGLCAVAFAAEPAQELDLPYCGIYSMYAAGRLLGKEIDFATAINPRFVSSPAGSTDADLIALAREYGLEATVHHNLTRLDLRLLSAPLILHVRREAAARLPDHWVLFAGLDSAGRAILIDGSRGRLAEDTSSLLSRWDGSALVVREPGQQPRVVPWQMAALAGVAMLGFLTWGARRWPLAEKPLPGHAALRGLVFVMGLAGAGALAGLADPASVVRNGDMRQAVVDRNIGKFLPTVRGRDHVIRMLRDPDVVVIDSRISHDFDLGHLPRAINVPVSSSAESARQALADVPTTRRLLIYCQNPDCNYAQRLAVTLRRLGYQNMTIYTGGYNDWTGRG